MENGGEIHAPASLPPGNSLRYTLCRREDGPQSWYGRYGGGQYIFPQQKIENRPLGRPTCSLVARGE